MDLSFRFTPITNELLFYHRNDCLFIIYIVFVAYNLIGIYPTFPILLL